MRVRSCWFQSCISLTSSYPRTPGSPMPDRRARIDEAGVDVAARGVDGRRALRHLHVRADGLDLAAADHDRAALDHRPR